MTPKKIVCGSNCVHISRKVKVDVLHGNDLSISATCGTALDSENGRHAPGSISFVPPTAGYILAGKCVRDIIGG